MGLELSEKQIYKVFTEHNGMEHMASKCTERPMEPFPEKIPLRDILTGRNGTTLAKTKLVGETSPPGLTAKGTDVTEKQEPLFIAQSTQNLLLGPWPLCPPSSLRQDQERSHPEVTKEEPSQTCQGEPTASKL